VAKVGGVFKSLGFEMPALVFCGLHTDAQLSDAFDERIRLRMSPIAKRQVANCSRINADSQDRLSDPKTRLGLVGCFS